MPKFRKKSLVIEAIQFRGYIEEKGGNYKDILDFMSIETTSFLISAYDLGKEIISIDKMTVFQDDWVIKGIRGEFYPCKPDIFEATYEAIN